MSIAAGSDPHRPQVRLSDRPPDAPGSEGPTHQELFQAALWYAWWGWRVFPVGPDKRPLCRWTRWRGRDQTDADLSAMFFRPGHSPRAEVRGVAVILGRCSGGLAVRDFDTVASYRSWAAARPDLAARLPTARTGRGYHVFHRTTAPDRFVRLPDGDHRADGGHFVVLPPSRHPSGRCYRWVGREPGSSRAFPVMTASEAGFLDAHATPLRVRPGGRPPRQSQESRPEAKNGFCPRQDTDVRFNALPEAVREAVLRTLPDRPGRRNDRLMYFARALYDIAPGVPADHWWAAAHAWWLMARRVASTQEWVVTWREFARAWGRLEKPVSQCPVLVAMRSAAAETDGSDADRLMAVCRAAAGVTGGPFKLSCRTAAGVLGVSKSEAHRLLDGAVARDHLKLVVRGRPSKTERVASLYRLPSGDARYAA